MRAPNVLQRIVIRRLRERLRNAELPAQLGLIIDGNRRWARQAGLENPSQAHRAGAEHVEDALSWCTAAGISRLTVFVCSTENLERRSPEEVAYLMRLIEEAIASRPSEHGWQLHIAGHLYTAGQPDIDLVIRTSGERRLSNWLLWQSTGAELIFSDAHWPAFREVDCLRALLTSSDRKTRLRELRAAS